MKKVERSIRDMQSAFFRRKETQKKRSRKQPRSQKTKGRKVPRAKRSSKTRHSNEFDFDGLDMGLEDILSELSPLQRLLLFLIIAVGVDLCILEHSSSPESRTDASYGWHSYNRGFTCWRSGISHLFKKKGERNG